MLRQLNNFSFFFLFLLLYISLSTTTPLWLPQKLLPIFLSDISSDGVWWLSVYFLFFSFLFKHSGNFTHGHALCHESSFVFKGLAYDLGGYF